MLFFVGVVKGTAVGGRQFIIFHFFFEFIIVVQGIRTFFWTVTYIHKYTLKKYETLGKRKMLTNSVVTGPVIGRTILGNLSGH